MEQIARAKESKHDRTKGMRQSDCTGTCKQCHRNSRRKHEQSGDGAETESVRKSRNCTRECDCRCRCCIWRLVEQSRPLKFCTVYIIPIETGKIIDWDLVIKYATPVQQTKTRRVLELGKILWKSVYKITRRVVKCSVLALYRRTVETHRIYWRWEQ